MWRWGLGGEVGAGSSPANSPPSTHCTRRAASSVFPVSMRTSMSAAGSKRGQGSEKAGLVVT